MRFLSLAAALTIILAALLIAGGCIEQEAATPAVVPSEPDMLGEAFDPRTAATLRGRVVWSGELPRVPPFTIQFNGDSSPVLRESITRLNPNSPVIDPQGRGVSGAVVFLRGVDLKRSRPWDQPPVDVEIRGRQFHVVQGDVDTRVGFVRKGESITLVSREAECHSVHGFGAGFFTLAFPDADQPLTRRMPEAGMVELISNAGFYWMRAHLFVSEHPYLARTDGDGRFVLKDVPPGEYDVVAWLPSWKVAGHDRDPETGFWSRVRFAAPAEKMQRITVAANGERQVVFEMNLGDFRP